jgi:hypothetical protein
MGNVQRPPGRRDDLLDQDLREVGRWTTCCWGKAEELPELGPDDLPSYRLESNRLIFLAVL